MSKYRDKKVDTKRITFVGISIFYTLKLVPTFMSFYMYVVQGQETLNGIFIDLQNYIHLILCKKT